MSDSNTRLGVNLDHVVTLREARHTPYPNLGEAIRVAEAAGADGITMHLREDKRHIQTTDVYASREVITTSMNLEMAATQEMLEIALDVVPDYCCIVPERREELTTEGGLNVIQNQSRLTDLCAALAEKDIQVSLFIEPDIAVIDTVKEIGAPIVELHTGSYADALVDDADREFDRIVHATAHAHSLGIQVNAGHGLNLDNVRRIAEIEPIKELNIGHALVARAVFIGLDQAIREMRRAMNGA